MKPTYLETYPFNVAKGESAQHSAAFMGGFDSVAESSSREDNPYRVGSGKWDDWNEGFDENQ